MQVSRARHDTQPCTPGNGMRRCWSSWSSTTVQTLNRRTVAFRDRAVPAAIDGRVLCALLEYVGWGYFVCLNPFPPQPLGILFMHARGQSHKLLIHFLGFRANTCDLCTVKAHPSRSGSCTRLATSLPTTRYMCIGSRPSFRSKASNSWNCFAKHRKNLEPFQQEQHADGKKRHD